MFHVLLVAALVCASFTVGESQNNPYCGGCMFNGRCEELNSQFTSNCNTYSCAKPFGEDSGYYIVTPIRAGCKDYRDVCRGPGETFRYRYSGKVYRNCTCQSQGTRSRVHCSVQRRGYRQEFYVSQTVKR